MGTSQMAGTEMLRIADLNVMETRVNVNENDIIRVNLLDTVLIEVDAYDHLNQPISLKDISSPLNGGIFKGAFLIDSSIVKFRVEFGGHWPVQRVY